MKIVTYDFQIFRIMVYIMTEMRKTILSHDIYKGQKYGEKFEICMEMKHFVKSLKIANFYSSEITLIVWRSYD